MLRPLVSAVMPTANRKAFVPKAIQCFLQQSYEPKELVILDNGKSVEETIPENPQIRYFHVTDTRPLGDLQNLCCDRAKGSLICHWDDDDWSSLSRIEHQVKELVGSGASVLAYHSVLFFDLESNQAWSHRNASHYPCGSSLFYFKSYWQSNPFPATHLGYDTYMFCRARMQEEIILRDGSDRMVVQRHSSNTSPIFWRGFQRKNRDFLPQEFLKSLDELRLLGGN